MDVGPTFLYKWNEEKIHLEGKSKKAGSLGREEGTTPSKNRDDACGRLK